MCVFISPCFGVSYVNGASASFDLRSSFSSLSVDFVALDEVDCDSVLLEDIGVETKRT